MKGIPMQNQIEIEKINNFLSLVSPVVVAIVKTILQTLGCDIKEEGSGLDLAFHIKSEGKEVRFFLNNLLLEIATVDRDEDPLQFDENLRDFNYFLRNMAHVVESKLNVLFQLFGQDDVEAAIENISKDAKQYERIRIWKVDQKGPT
jgi:hypothetical protein